MINVIKKGDKLYICLTTACRINDARLVVKVDAYKMAAGDLQTPPHKSYIVELRVENVVEVKAGETTALNLRGDC